jgi:hypothetical protein
LNVTVAAHWPEPLHEDVQEAPTGQAAAQFVHMPPGTPQVDCEVYAVTHAPAEQQASLQGMVDEHVVTHWFDPSHE